MGSWTVFGSDAYLQIGGNGAAVMGNGRHDCRPSISSDWVSRIENFDAQWELYRASDSVQQVRRLLDISSVVCELPHRKATNKAWLDRMATGNESSALVTHVGSYLIFNLYLPDDQFTAVFDMFKAIVGGASVHYRFGIEFDWLDYDEWIAGQECLLTGITAAFLPARPVK